jgi:uncharacterized protein
MNVSTCDTFFKRLRGFLFRKNLREGDALFFPRCNAVHSFFMTRTLHVYFLDKQLKVVREQELKPWRMAVCLSARHVLEVVEGANDNQ